MCRSGILRKYLTFSGPCCMVSGYWLTKPELTLWYARSDAVFLHANTSFRCAAACVVKLHRVVHRNSFWNAGWYRWRSSSLSKSSPEKCLDLGHLGSSFEFQRSEPMSFFAMTRLLPVLASCRCGNVYLFVWYISLVSSFLHSLCLGYSCLSKTEVCPENFSPRQMTTHWPPAPASFKCRSTMWASNCGSDLIILLFLLASRWMHGRKPVCGIQKRRAPTKVPTK